MKNNLFFTALVVLMSVTTANSQSANMIYDHNNDGLNCLYNHPHIPNDLLVVSGYENAAAPSKFYRLPSGVSQLIDWTFNNVDTIWGLPKFHGNEMFFIGSINGLGREVVMRDMNSTYFFDFNTGTGSSYPEIIEFEGEIFIIADDGSNRQLFKHEGGSNFQQLSFESSGDVQQFIAQRGNDYIYITYNTLDGRWIKSTTIYNGIVNINPVTVISNQDNIGDVVVLNNDVYTLSSMYSVVDASFRVDKIDASQTITTMYFETGGMYTSAKLLDHANQLLYYRTEPGYAEVLAIPSSGQEYVFTSLDPTQYNYISSHVAKDGKLFLVGETYVVDATNGTAVDVITDGNYINQAAALVNSDAFYLYEISPTSGGQSGIIEVDLSGNDFVRYDVSTDAGYMYLSNAMIENDGNIKFLFREEGTPSIDIYELNSVLSLEEDQLSEFVIYPNPIQLNGKMIVESNIEGTFDIMATNGKKVLSGDVFRGINSIQLNSLESGVYLFSMEGFTKRIVIQ